MIKNSEELDSTFFVLSNQSRITDILTQSINWMTKIIIPTVKSLLSKWKDSNTQ